jgi:hypothetical protein
MERRAARRRVTSSACLRSPALRALSVHRLGVGSEDSAVAVLVAGHGLSVRAGKRPARARR